MLKAKEKTNSSQICNEKNLDFLFKWLIKRNRVD